MSTTGTDDEKREEIESINLEPTRGQLGYTTDDPEWQPANVTVTAVDDMNRIMHIKGQCPVQNPDEEFEEQYVVALSDSIVDLSDDRHR